MRNILMLLSISLFIICSLNGFCQTISANDSIVSEHNSFQPADTIPIYFTGSDWLGKFDLDADGINDRIWFDYSGGAHCCYKIYIVLSRDSAERDFPFEMDGGYIAGVDSSQPEQFAIRDIDHDGLPEILMKIETYNAEVYPIPRKWKHLYGIKTNHIVIEYQNGRLITRDY
jgi:hypothetical protein